MANSIQRPRLGTLRSALWEIQASSTNKLRKEERGVRRGGGREEQNLQIKRDLRDQTDNKIMRQEGK